MNEIKTNLPEIILSIKNNNYQAAFLLLLNDNCKYNENDNKNKSAFDYLFEDYLNNVIFKNNIEEFIFQILLNDHINNEIKFEILVHIMNNKLYNLFDDILRKISDINIVSDNYNIKKINLLMYAININDEKIVEALIKYKIDINYEDSKNNNALSYAIDHSLKFKNDKIIKILIINNIVSNKNIEFTVINNIAKILYNNLNEFTQKSIISYYRYDGIKDFINVSDEYKYEFIHKSILHDYYELINFDIDLSRNNFNSNIIKTLLNIFCSEKVLCLALTYGSSNLIEYINNNLTINFGCDIESIKKFSNIINKKYSKFIASYIEDHSIINEFLADKILKNLFNEFELKPLILAINYYNNPSIVELLARNTNNINLKDNNPNHKINAILIAVSKNDIETAKILLSNGADPNSANFYNCTALMTAVYLNNIEMVKLLLKYKININAINKDNETAIVIAQKNNNTEIVELLLNNSANPEIRDELDKNVMDYASDFNNLYVIELLESKKIQ